MLVHLEEKKVLAMPIVSFRWDDLTDNIHQEVDENGSVDVQYSHKQELYGHVLSQRRISIQSFYHFDGIGSTRKLTDATQATLNSYTYSAFGEPILMNETTVNAFQYIGREGYYADAETGKIYVRERKYQPSNGRWMSRDPLASIFVMQNHYGYANNSPITLFDPSGLMTVTSSLTHPDDPDKPPGGISPCGGYRAYQTYQADFKPGRTAFAYIQKICIYDGGFTQECTYPDGYQGACSLCEPGDKKPCKPCCYLEVLLDDSARGLEAYPPATDTNQMVTHTQPGCTSIGAYAINATVKLIGFSVRVDLDKYLEIYTWDPPQVRTCSPECVRPSPVTFVHQHLELDKNTEPPDWWSDDRDGGNVDDKMNVCTKVDWNCCGEDNWQTVVLSTLTMAWYYPPGTSFVTQGGTHPCDK